MLADDLSRLELLLARSDNLLPLRKGKRRELIEKWERENGCFLPSDLVAFYEWADGENDHIRGIDDPEPEDFPLRDYSFVPFYSAIQGGEHCFHLRDFLIGSGIGDWDSVMRFVRPMWHHREDRPGEWANVDGHIFVPCMNQRWNRMPLIVDGVTDEVTTSAHFLCDDVRSFVQCWCLLLENGKLSSEEWRALNPFSFKMNSEIFRDEEWPHFFDFLWHNPYPWEKRV